MSKPFTVKELIQVLQKVNENLPVGICDPDWGYWNVNQLVIKDFDNDGKYLLLEGDSWLGGESRIFTSGNSTKKDGSFTDIYGGKLVDLSGEEDA